MATYERGKSYCICGHVGDGIYSDHAGLMGHGPCVIPSCDCGKFTWAGWTEDFEEHLKHQKAINS